MTSVKATFAEIDFSDGETPAQKGGEQRRTKAKIVKRDGFVPSTEKRQTLRGKRKVGETDEDGSGMAVDERQQQQQQQQQQQGGAVVQSAAKRARQEGVCGVSVRFHQPGDPDFSPVAVPAKGENTLREWQSGKCRCLQCESIRVASKLPGCTCVVLLDIDNWGLEELSTSTVRNLKVPEGVLFWCFYGRGLESHAKVTIESTDFSRGPDGKHPLDPLDRPVLGELQARHRLHFSIAGGHKQAADTAIVASVALLRNMHVLVITGDKELSRQALAVQRTMPPDGKRRDVHVINPHVPSATLASTWKLVTSWLTPRALATAAASHR